MSLANMSRLLKKVDDSYAVGAFNVSNMEMTWGTVQAAESLKAPLILQIAEESLRYSPLELLGPVMLAAARHAKVPVAVHLDRGSTFETIKLALDLGFTSVMFDGSRYPLDENIARTKDIAALARRYDAAVEGKISQAEESCASRDVHMNFIQKAKRFAEETGVDALAVTMDGTHGHFSKFREIAAATNVPLALHDAAGLSRDDFRQCLKNGIDKISIETASYDSAAAQIRDVLAEQPDSGYFDMSNAIRQGTFASVARHMNIFRLAGKG